MIRTTSILAIALFALLWHVPQQLGAQTLYEYSRAADKLLAEGDSIGALGVYRQAFDGVEKLLDPKARYKMAELAEGLRYYTVAKQQYAVIAASDRGPEFPDVRLRLAEAQRRTGAYEVAKVNYERVITETKDSAQVNLARKGISQADWALSRVTRMDSVEVMQLPAVVNTNNSEFAGVLGDGKLYFSRLELANYQNREAGTKSGVFALDAAFKDTLATRLPLHPGQHVAHFAQSQQHGVVYFTVCESIDIADFRCDIYKAGFSESGEIGEAEKLPAPINQPGATSTNPTVGRDDLSGDDLLIFSSNRSGGEGKMDLWMSRVGSDGRPGTPINLGFANTQEDDVTPFFHSATQSLFFSSKGHETLGGFDIFRMRYNSGNWEEAQGLRAPINSTFDDTYYALATNPARTYFSSNRPGATCEATEIRECCGFDLYSVDIAIELEVLAFDQLDSAALSETTITLIDLDTGEEVMRFTEASNLANFPVELGRNYRLVASRPGYGNDTLDFDTRDIYQPTLITKEMYLPPMLKMELYTVNAISQEPLNGVRVLWTNLGSADTIVKTERTSNLYTYEVEYGKTYWAKGTRTGFSPDTEIIATGGYQGTGRVIRDTLYLAPFAPLPLVLYFDNDYPNPNTTEPTTTLRYSETVPGYLAREPEFLAQGTRGRNAVSRPEMAAFFDEVERNHNKLLEFSSTLVKYLRDGNEIDIIIEGYASPLAQTDYNIALTSRRTRSIINHFAQWESGALLPFLRTGQLRIRQEPLGERQAPAGISDSPRNRRESEFGLRASRERKVRIIDIQRREELPLSQRLRSSQRESQNLTR